MSEEPAEVTFEDLPEPEFEGLYPREELTVDGDNPNTMAPADFDALVEKIRQRGWVGNAIVTDTDGLIADGEHRWLAAKELGLETVPVKMYDVPDGERRLLRQELNKLRGRHDIEDDASEYELILAESDSANTIAELAESIGTDEEDIQNTIDQFTSEDPVIDDDIPDAFDDVNEQETEHECPNCGYRW